MLEALRIIESASTAVRKELREADSKFKVELWSAAALKLLRIFDCIHNADRMERKLFSGIRIADKPQKKVLLDILDAEIIGDDSEDFMLITKIELNLSHLVDEATDNQIFPEVIRFYAKPHLEKDYREVMLAHVGLPETERAEKQHEANVETLSRLAHKVEGLPNFEANGNLRESLKNYLSEKTEANEFLAQALIDEHLDRTKRYSFR